MGWTNTEKNAGTGEWEETTYSLHFSRPPWPGEEQATLNYIIYFTVVETGWWKQHHAHKEASKFISILHMLCSVAHTHVGRKVYIIWWTYLDIFTFKVGDQSMITVLPFLFVDNLSVLEKSYIISFSCDSSNKLKIILMVTCKCAKYNLKNNTGQNK